MLSKKEKSDEKEPSKPVVARTAADIQRLKLEKLMKNPDKEVIIPEKPKERGAPVVPDFVRNVMGSSAGAGSGEFHVYRHLRRKEYARQHYMTEKAKWERLEEEYHQKIEDNKRKSEELTAKKRAKRMKKKKNSKKPKNQVNKSPTPSASEESDDDDCAEGLPSELKETDNTEKSEISNDVVQGVAKGVPSELNETDNAENETDTVQNIAESAPSDANEVNNTEKSEISNDTVEDVSKETVNDVENVNNVPDECVNDKLNCNTNDTIQNS